MPRRAPPLVTGECYHVYNRGVDRKPVFLEASDYASFLLRLHHFLRGSADHRIGTVRPKGGALVLAYCLMPNHYHLILIPGTDRLSHQMQMLSISYTKSFNRKYGRVGPLFQGQFRAVAVSTPEQLLSLTAYIHANPFGAGLEKSVGEWPYSSHPEYVGARDGTLPSRELVLSLAGGPDSYRSLMAAYDSRGAGYIRPLLLEERDEG